MAELLLKYHPIPEKKDIHKDTQQEQEPVPAKRTDKYSVDYSGFDKMVAGENETRK